MTRIVTFLVTYGAYQPGERACYTEEAAASLADRGIATVEPAEAPPGPDSDQAAEEQVAAKKGRK